MKPSRRAFLNLVASGAALPAISPLAQAEAYPSRPVHIIVPVAPGGALDIIARLIGQSLTNHLGQSFIIENRPVFVMDGSLNNFFAEREQIEAEKQGREYVNRNS